MAGDISQHFSWREFSQPARHGFVRMAVPEELRPRVLLLVHGILQPLRDQLDAPIEILSAFRSLPYNRKIGSKDTSRHPRGDAADIRARGYSAAELHAEILRRYKAGLLPSLGGLGLYPTFVHVDARDRVNGRLARWTGSRKDS